MNGNFWIIYGLFDIKSIEHRTSIFISSQNVPNNESNIREKYIHIFTYTYIYIPKIFHSTPYKCTLQLHIFSVYGLHNKDFQCFCYHKSLGVCRETELNWRWYCVFCNGWLMWTNAEKYVATKRERVRETHRSHWLL